MKPWKCLYTAEQLRWLLCAMGFGHLETPKRKKTFLRLEFPPGVGYARGSVTPTDKKSTYGKPLYQLTLYN